MPWKAHRVSDIRLAFVHQVRTLNRPVAASCRDFGISRNTGYKWLRRFDADPATPLADRSRRPQHSPEALEQTAPDLARILLVLRDRYGWGARKLVAMLPEQALQDRPRPAIRSVTRLLGRHGRISRPTPADRADQHFERPEPHDLWQLDFKGPLEVERRRVHPLVILDDHSRYCLCLKALDTHDQEGVWDVLWDVFGEMGLPRQLLADNEFGSRHRSPRTLSRLESKLIRLGIDPIHGRPYHPQTQGKVERFNGTLQRELWPSVRRDSLEHFTADARAFRDRYNHLRPHEALADQPPIARFAPSPRQRPEHLPEVSYPPGSVLRKVSTVGDIRWRRYRILAGRGLVGQWISIEERDHELVLFYAHHPIRSLPYHHLALGRML